MDMEYLLIIIPLIFLSFACVHVLRLLKPNPGNLVPIKLPPGPTPFPIIGNILEVGNKPHQSLAKLSKMYGPLMHLKLGSLTTIVASSPEVAKLVLQRHDRVFSNRVPRGAIQALDHHLYSIAFRSSDSEWRKLRKICKEIIFSGQKLDASQGLRMEKLNNLRDYLNECCNRGEVVDIGRACFTTSLNLISSSLFSMDFASFGSDSSQVFKDIVCGIMEYVGKPNFVDYFPFLRAVDPQGILRKTTFYFKKCFEIFDDIIVKRLKTRDSSEGSMAKNDMLEALLDINKKNECELSIVDIKHLLLDLFVAGTDTTSGIVEWAMAELLRNPEKMLKAKNEVRTVMGRPREQITESDISKLSYLRAVVNETFRLHPTAPFLLPHKANEDREINGYFVPRNAQILVNVWAIGRDSSVWLNPNTFMPERFLEEEIDFFGQHFELIPFGTGRIICPGLPLAYRMVHFMLVTLINDFDWKLDHGQICNKLDMSEKFGRLSLEKAVPLKAVPIKR